MLKRSHRPVRLALSFLFVLLSTCDATSVAEPSPPPAPPPGACPDADVSHIAMWMGYRETYPTLSIHISMPYSYDPIVPNWHVYQSSDQIALFTNITNVRHSHVH